MQILLAAAVTVVMAIVMAVVAIAVATAAVVETAAAVTFDRSCYLSGPCRLELM
jgi:hypothetical protein